VAFIFSKKEMKGNMEHRLHERIHGKTTQTKRARRIKHEETFNHNIHYTILRTSYSIRI